MSRKNGNRKDVYLFLLLKNQVTDFVETWDIDDNEDVEALRKVFNLVNSSPRFRLKIASSGPVPKKLSWLRSVSVITPDTKTLTNRERTVFENIDTFEYFANVATDSDTRARIKSVGFQYKLHAQSRWNIQKASIDHIVRTGNPVLAADGSLVPPNYSGWAVIGPTGILAVDSHYGKNRISSNQSELYAIKSALEKISHFHTKVDISTDSYFMRDVINGIRTDKEMSLRKLRSQADKNQITINSVNNLSKLVASSPHANIIATKAHSNDPLNNYADTASREAAKQLRETKLHRTADVFTRKNTKNSLHIIHTGNYISDMWGLVPKTDLREVIRKMEPYKDQVAFVTDTRGDNQWLRELGDKDFKYYEIDDKDPLMSALKKNLYRFRKMDISLTFEEKISFQPVLLKLFTSTLKEDDLIAYLHITPEYALVCGGWFETTLFQVYRFDTPDDEKRFYQEILDICRYTDTRTSLVIQGTSDLFTTTKNKIAVRPELLTKSPKTTLRKPRNGEAQIFKLASIVKTHREQNGEFHG